MQQTEEQAGSEALDNNDIYWQSLTDEQRTELLILVGLRPTDFGEYCEIV